MDEENVNIEFWKKINLASEAEPCDECLAKPVCKLREQLHKLSVDGKDKTIIEQCSLMVT